MRNRMDEKICNKKEKKEETKKAFVGRLLLTSIRGGIAALFLMLCAIHLFPETAVAQYVNVRNETESRRGLTYERLMSATRAEVDKQNWDIAEVNLLCAKNLPGAEKLDVRYCLNELEKWTDFVRRETERQMYKFFRNPKDFYNSEAYFKVLVMVTALQRDIGAGYNMELVESGAMNDNDSMRFFEDSKDLFLHGFFSPSRSGTCSSMPVLVAAVGRRLGYPIKLVETKRHLFARWDDKKEKFNIETAGRGLNVFPDSHYKNFPFTVSENEIRMERLLESMSPSRELSGFFSTRAYCLIANGRYDEALQAFEKALSLWPQSVILRMNIEHLNRKRIKKQ